jgi:hypothetical protein
MPLLELSKAGSLMYSEDFRTGRTLFSKGALMAEEIDVLIRQREGEEATARFVSRDDESGREVRDARFVSMSCPGSSGRLASQSASMRKR